MCGQHNVRASAEDNTGQNTDKEHTPNPTTEIKIPDPAGNRTLAAGLEGRDSTDHATARGCLQSWLLNCGYDLFSYYVAFNFIRFLKVNLYFPDWNNDVVFCHLIL